MTGTGKIENEPQLMRHWEVLSEGKEPFRMIMERMKEVIFETDPDLTVTYITPSIKKLLGYEAQEIVGHTLAHFMTQAGKELISKNHRDFIKRQEFSERSSEVVSDVELTGKDGAIVWTEVAFGPVFDSLRSIKGFQGSMRDVSDHVMAVKALRESEENFDKAFMLNPDAIAISRLSDSVIVRVNKGFTDTLGYEPHEVVGKTATELNIWADPEERNTLIRELRQKGRVDDFESGAITKSGQRRFGLVSAAIIEINGVQHSIIGVKDLTDRVRAEDDLRLSERKYRMVFDVAPIGITLIDTEGKVVEVNQTILEILGSPSPEATKAINMLTFPPLIEAGISDLVSSCISDKKRIDAEVFYTTKWGKEIYLRSIFSPKLDESGCSEGCLAVMEDVSARKSFEKALTESEEKYRALIETTGTGYLIIDAQGRVVDANTEYLRLSGHKRLDEIINAKMLEWTAPHHKNLFLTAIEQCFKKGHIRGLEIDLVNSEGQFTPVEINGSVVRIGQTYQILSLCRDISQRKRSQEDLKRAKDVLEAAVQERTERLRKANEKLELEILVRKRAEQEIQKSHDELAIALDLASRLCVQAEAASHAKSEFLTNMSHELRTPLTAVIGFSNLLADQFYGKLNDKQLKYANEISDAGRHLLTLINDILDLAKIESGKMDVKMSDFDLGLLLEKCLIMTKETAAKRGLKVELKVSDELSVGNIEADEVRIKQIVINLLSNAVKFTPQGGKIKLQAERMDEEILVSVSDSGIGMRPEDQDRIFQAFEQLDSSSSRRAQGTGLGLALVSKLVEISGGRVWVESPGTGKGSTFRFTFPFLKAQQNSGPQNLVPAERHASSSHEQPSSNTLRRSRVLVVEDSKSNMKLFMDLLEAQNYQAVHALTAEEAISKAESDQPSLILMDLSLPNMDGLQATRILKKNPATSHIPIVALTAHVSSDDARKAKEAGCDAYIVKPVDTVILFRTLSRLIKK